MIANISNLTYTRVYDSSLDAAFVRDVDWSPNDQLIALSISRKVVVIEADTRRIIANFTGIGYVDDMSFSPDSKYLAMTHFIGTDYKIRIYLICYNGTFYFNSTC